MHGEAFDKCIGCSHKITNAYKEDKRGFVLRACNEPDFLEVITYFAYPKHLYRN